MNNAKRSRIRLSKRLAMSAGFVRQGCTAADIGCDHAYMAIYLIQQGIAEHVVAMDVNPGPLMRAKENIARLGYTDRIETRLSDGTLQLRPGEADTILCAGMGGKLIIHALSANTPAALAAKEWILQPQSEIHLVRRYIWEMGYRIADEKMCREDGKFYTAIHAVKEEGHEGVSVEEITDAGVCKDAGKSAESQPNAQAGQQRMPGAYACELFGRPLIARREPVLREYLLEEEAKLLLALESLKGQDADAAAERRLVIEKKYSAICEVLRLWDAETEPR